MSHSLAVLGGTVGDVHLPQTAVAATGWKFLR